MKRTYWHADATPIETTLDKVLYDIRRDDGTDGLIFDAVSLRDLEEAMDARLTLDAMLSPYNKLESKMSVLEQVMNRAGTAVKVTARQLSEPFTQNGTANVVALFELSDGQTVSIYFHNPDTTPKKILPTDEMISWKWLLNKKDITIVVAPEKGKDLNVRQVATRIMKLAETNSKGFQRANTKRAERMAEIDGLRTEISQLEGTLKGKLSQIEALKVEVEDREIRAADKSGQVGQGIDPVTRANIEAAPISAAIKKKVLAYLEANPHSHQLAEKETPAIKKAKDTILDNLQIALKAEIMTLTPLIYVDSGNDMTLILGDQSTSDHLRIYIGKERMSFGIYQKNGVNKQIFDSTKTLEDLRAWNFNLPFDLDVKAFVANVIKPMVDEFLSREMDKSGQAEPAPRAYETEDLGIRAVEMLTGKSRQAEPAPEAESNAGNTFSVYRDGDGALGKKYAEFDKSYQMGNFLDAIDEPPGTFYGKNETTGDIIFSFQARTIMIKARKRLDREQFYSLFHEVKIWANNEHGQYGMDWIKRNAPSYMALKYGIDADWAAKAIEQRWMPGNAGNMSTEPAPEAENTEPFRHEGFNIYPVKMKGENGAVSERWAVQSIDNLEREQAGERQVGGDEIVNTQAEAKARAERQAVQMKEKADLIAKIEKEQADDAAKKAETIAAFADFVAYKKLSPPSAEKARQTLSKNVSADGKNQMLKDLIESLVAEGRFIGEDNGMRTLEHPDGRFRDEKQLTKTGMDYAEFLIQKRDEGQTAITGSEVEPISQPTLSPEGRANNVKTAKGTKVETGFKLMEVDDLIVSHNADGSENPDYPQELQPRDRGRATSQAWVTKTANNLDPESLGRTSRADTGAPIVGPDGVVESGNGRSMAIREAYRLGKADEYKQWLEENADYFGVSPEKVKSMKKPVLVRIRTSAINRAEFAVEANQDDKLAMTATEKARADANRLTEALIARMTDDGDLLAASNRPFINAFLQSLGDTEAAQYITSSGQPTASLMARVQAAIFAKAYNDDRLLELTADSAKPEIANIINALNVAAPDFIRAINLDRIATESTAEQLTDSIELAMKDKAIGAILGAINVVEQARRQQQDITEYVSQAGLFGDVDPNIAAMAIFIAQNNRSAKRMGMAFKAMAEFLGQEIERLKTEDVFGDNAPAEFSDLIKAANRKLQDEYGDNAGIRMVDMFGQNIPQRDVEPVPDPYRGTVPPPTPEIPDIESQIARVEALIGKPEFDDELDKLVAALESMAIFSQYEDRLSDIAARDGIMAGKSI